MTATPTRHKTRTTFASSLDRSHPWSELGVNVEHLNYYQALKESGSDDQVTAQTLYVRDYDTENRELVEVPGKIATYSNIYGPMGVNSTSYEIMQRHEILDLAFDIAGLTNDEANVKVIGNIGQHAEKFFAYVVFPELVIDPNGVADTVERGLWVATSFDGSLPNIIGYGAIRLWCLNQLTMHLKRGLSQSIRVRHTKNMEDRMHEAAVALNYVGAVEKEMVKNAEQMLSVDGDKAMNALLQEFWPKSDDLSKHTAEKRAKERGQVMQLFEGHDNTNIDKVGRNGWAAYNAVVEYLDHARPVRLRGGTEKLQRAEAAVLPGTITDKKVKASNVVLALAA